MLMQDVVEMLETHLAGNTATNSEKIARSKLRSRDIRAHKIRRNRIKKARRRNRN